MELSHRFQRVGIGRSLETGIDNTVATSLDIGLRKMVHWYVGNVLSDEMRRNIGTL